jgi:hypothetical protein
LCGKTTLPNNAIICGHIQTPRGHSIVTCRTSPGAAVKIFTDSIEEYVEKLVAKEYPPGVAEQNPGVAEQPWGSLDMLLIDPFGNRLIFTNSPIRTS